MYFIFENTLYANSETLIRCPVLCLQCLPVSHKKDDMPIYALNVSIIFHFFALIKGAVQCILSSGTPLTLLRMISGAKYSGVPHRVQVRPFTLFAKPKSVTWKKNHKKHNSGDLTKIYRLVISLRWECSLYRNWGPRRPKSDIISSQNWTRPALSIFLFAYPKCM